MATINNGNPNGGGSNESNTAAVVSTQVPGVDMTQVIPSQPYMVKENSSKIETREVKLDKG
jgi:hypothetical protein